MPKPVSILTTAALLVAALGARPLRAQLPGLPLFQGAFPSPGLAAGVDVGRAESRTMTAAAVGYGPRSERFGLVAGLGLFNNTAPGYGGSHIGYGARFALTAFRFAGQRLAVTPFAGYGSSRGTLESGTLAGLSATPEDTGAVLRTDEFPFGVAVGFRTRLGATRALALSLAPAYTLDRRSGGTLDASHGGLRVSAVAEVAVMPQIGVTLATEFGQSATGEDPGPRGSRIGLGLSYAFAKR